MYYPGGSFVYLPCIVYTGTQEGQCIHSAVVDEGCKTEALEVCCLTLSCQLREAFGESFSG